MVKRSSDITILTTILLEIRHKSKAYNQLTTSTNENNTHLQQNHIFIIKMASKLSIQAVNKLSEHEFLDLFKNVVELWPRAAETVYDSHPFTDLEELVAKFENYLETLSVEDKIEVLQSHPDLAGKLLDENKLSEESAQEQASIGLNKLTVGQKTELVQLNDEYRNKFGFPFVICVRQSKKIEAILEGFHYRLPNDRIMEIFNGIAEVKKICKIRTSNIVDL